MRIATCLLLLLTVLAAHEPSPRSPKWQALRNAYLKAHPSCVVCGKPAEEVHHIAPFHVDPAKELDIANLCSLCADDHLRIGHLGNFQNINQDVLLHARILRTAKARADAVRKSVDHPPNVIVFVAADRAMSVDVGDRRATASEISDIVSQLNAIAGGLQTTK